MLKVNRVGDSITGAINGKQFGIAFSPTKWEKLLELQKKVDEATTPEELQPLIDQATNLTTVEMQDLIDHFTPFVALNREKGTYHLRLSADKVSPIVLPKAFVQRIEDSVSKNIDITPLVKGITRFLRNPRLNAEKLRRFSNYINMTYKNAEMEKELLEKGFSEAVAKERSTTYQTPLTAEGLLCTYKVSTEIDHKFVDNGEGGVKSIDRHDYEIDEFTGLKTYKKSNYVEDRVFQPAVMGTGGDAFVCHNIMTGNDYKGHIIRVGHVHFLEEERQLNSDDHSSCVPGLHIGGLDYIRGYQGEGTVTHNVFADPMDIGAIPDDNTGAIRVKRYFVHSSFAGVNRAIYHSSKFAEITDAEFAKFVEEAVAASKKKYEADMAPWLALTTE